MTDQPSNLFMLSGPDRPGQARAEHIYIWSDDGRRFIDGSSGAMVVNVGHSNPRVIEAMKEQLDRATFAYRSHFKSAAAEGFARDLAAMMPGDLSEVFMVSGGSEAVESAIKLVRQRCVSTGEEGRYKVISLDTSYHGSTLGALAVTGHEQRVAPFRPLLVDMPKVPTPTAYLDRDHLSAAEQGLRYAAMLEDKILAEGPDSVMAFIMEPVGGAATGAHVAPDSYYPAVRQICDRHGVALIYDEVMSGIGRTGRFVAAEHWQVEPDIVVLSKGLGAGYVPLGAIVASQRFIKPVVDSGGFVHGHTYAGSPLAAAAGRAVLAEVRDRDLAANAEAMGQHLMARLEEIKSENRFVGDVRGKGLLTGIELVADRESMEIIAPDLNAHSVLTEMCYDRQLIVYSGRCRGGAKGDHVQICPPLVIDEAELDELVDIFADAMVEFSSWLDSHLN